MLGLTTFMIFLVATPLATPRCWTSGVNPEGRAPPGVMELTQNVGLRLTCIGVNPECWAPWS